MGVTEFLSVTIGVGFMLGVILEGLGEIVGFFFTAAREMI